MRPNRTAIRLDDLGKQYIIGRATRRNGSLRSALAENALGIARGLRSRIRRNGEAREPESRIWALQKVSLEIAAGEAVGIIGGNGAGKSTLLKILSRITEPTTGCAVIYGRVGSLLEVGTGFHPELTGRENIYLNGAILGMTHREMARKLDAIVDFAGIEPFLDTPVKRYSSGMYLRLAFSVAAHLEPNILLVDEVLAVGDATFQRKCLGRMGDVTRQGRTVLFVSHSMDAIRRLCSRTVLLDGGQVVLDSDSTSAISRYLLRDSDDCAPDRWIDLSRARRIGTGEIRFLGARYTSLNAAVGYRAFPGGPLEFTLALAADAARSVESMAVVIFDQAGTKLINADTVEHGQVLRLEPGRNEVALRITAVHLTPGAYVVGLWLADSVGSPFDYVEAAFAIEVVEHESKAFGSTPASNGLVPCSFTAVQTGLP